MMKQKRWFRLAILIGLLALVFAGCSGDSDSSSGTVTISGRAVDDPIASGEVSVLDVDGVLLASDQTDIEGYYSVEVNKADIQDGYEIRVKGGEINSEPFTGELRAYYGPSDDRSAANATLITTLVAAFSENADGDDMLTQRDNAISSLSRIGLCKTEGWAAEEPELADMSALRFFVSEKGLDVWLTEMCEDLKDGDLCFAMMKGFPQAHGGIVSVSTDAEQNRFSVLPGDEVDGTLTADTNGSAGELVYEVVQGPDGMAVDAQGHMTCTLAADAAENSDISFTIRVSNSQNGFGREITGTVSVMAFGDVDNDGDGYSEAQGDCNDADNTVYPGAAEICGDGVDQNCDGKDADCAETDNDGDGYTEAQGDCNDADAAVHPGAAEICGDGVDQDCDGSDPACPEDTDDDADGYTENQGDCDDADASVNPGATDVCGDGVDQDCDGADAVCPELTWYKDADGDGYSDGTTKDAVEQPEGYYEADALKAVSGDCDDAKENVHPGATEICGNGIDEDCSGSDATCYTPSPSPTPTTYTYYKDADGDGYSDGTTQQASGQPSGYYLASALTATSGDCDDDEPTVNPGAEEINGDSTDNDCDGITDEHARAILGPLAGATVNVYRLNDLETFVYTTSTDNQGYFSTLETEINPEEYVLVAVSGGTDTDPNDDGDTSDATPNTGTVYGIIKASELNGGSFIVSALSDIVWRYTENLVEEVDTEGLKLRLDDLAILLFKEGTDLNGDETLDHKDILSFNPLEAGHRDALSFDFQAIMEPGETGKSLLDCYHENLSETFPTVLKELFGTRMTLFPAADSRNTSVKVKLIPFGHGQVTGSMGNIDFDSERTTDQNMLYDFYNKAEDENVVLTATPAQGSEILGWEGCDSVSEDNTQCTCSLAKDRNVQVIFGYAEVQTKSDFVDLSRALVNRNNDELHVYAAHNDTEMAADLANLTEGMFVVGYASGGFLLKVLSVEKINDYEYVLTTSEDAGLEDIIAQGTGTLTRKMTHGDLSAGMNSGTRSKTRSSASGLEGVRLLPSDDPDDDVFRIQIGNPGNANARSGELGHWKDEISIALKDGNAEAELKIKGQLDLEVLVHTAVSYGLTGLEEFKLIPEITSTEKLDVTLSGELSKKKWEKPLATLNFGKLSFAIGPVPVWISFKLSISVDIEGKIKAEVTTGIELQQNVQAGFTYRKSDGFSPTIDFNNSWKFNKPDLDNEISLKVGLSPKLGILLYDVTGPEISIEPGLELRAKLLKENEEANNCRGGVDISTYFVLQSKWKLIFSENTKIGKLLHLKDIEGSEPLFKKEWPINSWNYPGTHCDLQPAKLDVTGDNIGGIINYGSGDIITRQYVLKNSGNYDLEWGIEYTPDGILSVSKTQGELGELESETVTLSIDTSELSMGVYLKRLKFKNTSGSILSRVADYLTGNAERLVSIIVMPPSLSEPVLSEPVSLSPTNVELSWEYPDSDTLKYVNGYYVFKSTDNETWEIAPDGIITDASKKSIIMDNLFPDTTYYFAVAAFDKYSSQSSPSNTVQFVVDSVPGGEAPAAPTGVTAVEADGQITVSWEEVDGVAYYNLYMATTESVGKDNYASLDGGRKFTEVSSPYTISGLVNGITYYIMVTSVNTFGESAESSEISASPFKVTEAPAAVPSLLSVPGDSQVTLNWPAVQGASIYNLYMAEVSGVTKSNYDSLQGGRKLAAVTSPYVVTDLTNDTTYYFRVTSENVFGESPDSGETSSTPSSSMNTFSAPTNINVSTGDRSMTITWDPVEGAALYRLYVAAESGITKTNYVNLTDAFMVSGMEEASYTHTNLTNGTTYYFVLTAMDVNGVESDESIEMSATPTGSGTSDRFEKLAGGTMILDHTTGLIWEVKENLDGEPDYDNPSDADNTYTWYDPNPDVNLGDAGVDGQGTDTQDFLQALKAKTGYDNWRLPTREELYSLVDFSSGSPLIDKNFFPNTKSSRYWTSGTLFSEGEPSMALHVDFKDDSSVGSYKFYSRHVRAVRSGQ